MPTAVYSRRVHLFRAEFFDILYPSLKRTKHSDQTEMITSNCNRGSKARVRMAGFFVVKVKLGNTLREV